MGKIKLSFGVVKGSDLLKQLRDQVVELDNEITLEMSDDVIVIPLEDSKPKTKTKSIDMER